MQSVPSIQPPLELTAFSEIIDVRSPSEFAKDHIPGAINLPVLDDAQRHHVGKLHSEDHFAARRLGAELITAAVSRHLHGHLSTAGRDYAPLIYCWRGGLRSHSTAFILHQIGWRARVLKSGYKGFRKWLSDDLADRLARPRPSIIVLSGSTGTGKTRLLHQLREAGQQVLDLEALAHHRGSVLGLIPGETQPSQKMFETQLWHQLSQFDENRPIFAEAESNRIGGIHCPPPLWQRLANAVVVRITMPIEQRAKFLLKDYPHFTEQPDELKQRLEQLVRLRGHQLINHWHELIDAGNWSAFVTSILEKHYDLSYRKAGDTKSNYASPGYEIHLSSCSQHDFASATVDLIKIAQQQPS